MQSESYAPVSTRAQDLIFSESFEQRMDVTPRDLKVMIPDCRFGSVGLSSSTLGMVRKSFLVAADPLGQACANALHADIPK